MCRRPNGATGSDSTFPRLRARYSKVVRVMTVFSEAGGGINEWVVSSDGGIGYESVKPTLTTLRETWGGSSGRQAQD